MRTCEICGKKFYHGMTTDEGDMYVCGRCFEQYMDETYGKHNWMMVNDDGCGGYYVYRDVNVGGYFGTGIYYTEWED